MLVAMDGNESLKCMARTRHSYNTGKATDTNVEHQDTRNIPSDMYLGSNEVDVFKYEVKHCRAALPVSIVYYTLDSSTLSL
jgi:hypothetical protein